MTLDELCVRASGEGIEIDDVRMMELREACFPEGWIAMDGAKYATRTEYKCDLAHAIGHCETGAFYNVYSPYDLKEKCERKANIRAAQILMPLPEVREVLQRGMTDLWALAEHFDVTPDFAEMALGIYADDLQRRPHRHAAGLPPMMKARDLLSKPEPDPVPRHAPKPDPKQEQQRLTPYQARLLASAIADLDQIMFPPVDML